jgi:transketolase
MDTHMTTDIDTLCVNTMRTLAMDAVQKANSGHPGTPMSMAPVAYELWQNHLNFDPADPIWPNRDRFVLSVGHASMLLYSLLHLTRTMAVGSGYNSAGHVAVTLDDIRHFRQIDSRTPGHPEYHLTSGVETTTGPLGQGCGNSVGMAIAQRWLAARYNKPGYDVFDYRVYALCGDGDMMEGISAEAASLAGHLQLGNLCWIYDSNRITIEGGTDLAFSESVADRFRAYGWAVAEIADANDRAALRAELNRFAAGAHGPRPMLILVHSIIAWGAPNRQGTKEAHGEALGEQEVRLAKRFFNWPEDAQFLVPDGVYDNFARGIGARAAAANADWKALIEKYRADHADLAHEIDLIERRDLPEGWDRDIPVFPADPKGMASRDSSGKVLNAIAPNLPWLLGGAADLAPSTKTRMTFPGAGDLEARDPGGRNMHFGIREHAMGAVVNGMVLSKLRAFGSGFLIFSDYMRAPIRLSSLMELPATWIFTHDSIAVGEDGPTHQPIEQLVSLRAIPGMIVLRPADANEVAEAWRVILQLKHHPVCLVLSRQPLPTLSRETYASAAGVVRGAYILSDPDDGDPDLILIGTGSEVQFCVAACETLKAEGIRARVVSMPSWELFERQDEEYRKSVLPDDILARVTVEQASVIGWDRYAGATGTIIGMRSFGASAPMKDLLTKFGFSADAVVKAARHQIGRE